MSRKKTAAAETITTDAPDVFDEAIAAQNAAAATAVVEQVAESTRIPENAVPAQPAKTHAQAVGKREFKPAPDPFGTENIAGEGNRAQLLKSMADRAWIIRFEKNPNEMKDAEGVAYSKERPHPVLKMLKDEGYRWGFSDGDGNGGWGKVMQEGHYTYAEHMDARKVLAKAAEMIGAKIEQGRIPD